MTRRRLQVEKALRALPEVDELTPLRELLVAESRPDGEGAWTGARALLTLDTRVVDAAGLEPRAAELAERVRERTERVLRHSMAALRALQMGDPAGAARALIAAGEVEEEAHRLDPARRYYEKALELGRQPRDRSVEGVALRRLGRVARLRGDRDEALRRYEEGYRVAVAMRDAEGVVVGCQGVGNVLGETGRWPEARDWYLRGLEALEGTAESVSHWQLYNNLAIVEGRAGDRGGAERWLERASRVVEALGDPVGELFVLNARGRLHLALEEPDRAEGAFRGALERARAPLHRVTVLSNLADARLRQGHLREAEETARDAETLALAHRLSSSLVDIYRTIGNVRTARADPDGVLFFEQALELCAALRLPAVELGTVQHDYARFEAATGQPEAALERLRLAVETLRAAGAAPELARAEADLARLQPRVETQSDS